MQGREAVPYAAGREESRPLRIEPEQGKPPVADCIMTGYGAAEPSLAIASDGTIFYAPVFTPKGNGLIRSRDKGKTWDLIIPRFGNTECHSRVQTYLYLDPATDRVFFHSSLLRMFPPRLKRGFNLTWSDDQGDTWHHVKLEIEALDWLKVYAGPPARSETSDYPNIVYMSAPTPISTRCWPGLFPKLQQVWRSLDGGNTWENAGCISLVPHDHGLPRHEWIIFGSGVVAKDGTVYLGFRRGPRLGLAVSRDEGKTWEVKDVPGSRLLRYFNILQIGIINGNYVFSEPLALDGEGNLYAIWPDDKDVLRMAYSRDGGHTWSAPVVVSAPEVKHVRYHAMTVREPGRVAIAYYGSPNGLHYHGYIAESSDAFKEEPIFWSATVNDPSDPLYRYGFNVGYLEMWFGGDLNEIVHIRYSPDGDIWASFCKRMPPLILDRSWKRGEHAYSKLQGVIGRMRWFKS